jgi:hypothetical protein
VDEYDHNFSDLPAAYWVICRFFSPRAKTFNGCLMPVFLDFRDTLLQCSLEPR